LSGVLKGALPVGRCPGLRRRPGRARRRSGPGLCEHHAGLRQLLRLLHRALHARQAEIAPARSRAGRMPPARGARRARNHPAGAEREQLRSGPLAPGRRRWHGLCRAAAPGGGHSRPAAPALHHLASQGHRPGSDTRLWRAAEPVPVPAPALAVGQRRGAAAHGPQVRPRPLPGHRARAARRAAGAFAHHGPHRRLSRRDRGRFCRHAGDDGARGLRIELFLLLFRQARRGQRAHDAQGGGERVQGAALALAVFTK
jgi:hypothetical protein